VQRSGVSSSKTHSIRCTSSAGVMPARQSVTLVPKTICRGHEHGT
jgi:hypothetical protein